MKENFYKCMVLNDVLMNTMRREIREILAVAGIIYFHFTEIYFDGRRYFFSTHPQFIEYVYTTDLYKMSLLLYEPALLDSSSVLWKNLSLQDHLKDVRNAFMIGNDGGTVIYRSRKSVKLYHFSAKDTSGIIDLFSAKRPLLHTFINYFHVKYSSVINELSKNKFYIPVADPTNYVSIKHTFNQTLLDKIHCKRYYLHTVNKFLTSKEFNIVNELMLGKTANQISKSLSVSKKTIETHIQNIKNKFNAKKISQVLLLLRSEPIFSCNVC
jgi:DNA-binding CsgD family transcriptional regulator